MTEFKKIIIRVVITLIGGYLIFFLLSAFLDTDNSALDELDKNTNNLQVKKIINNSRDGIDTAQTGIEIAKEVDDITSDLNTNQKK